MEANRYIDFLEDRKQMKRIDICYQDFNKNNLKDYLLFMQGFQHLSEKTCNLQLTAVRALLAYASEESMDITAIYVNAKMVKGLTVSGKAIEYFEEGQTRALLKAPPVETKIGRRNKMIMILGYDAGLRVSFYATTHGVRHPLSDDTMQNLLKKYADISRNTIRMPKEIHFHMLRKTRAMDLYQTGCPLSYIQQLLGHENISTTSGFYAFATLKTLADAIEKANPSGAEEKGWKDESVLKQLHKL